MSKNTSTDRSTFIIGILIIGVLVWQFGGYLLPDKETQKTGETFLAEVMEASGGKEAWKNIDQITFTKKFKLYQEDGSVEIDRTEMHSYDFTADTNRLIQWKEGEILYNLVQRDTALFQTANRIIDTTATRSQLQNKLNAATFVLGLPFTLEDNNSVKTYNDIMDFEGQPAHELEVSFKGSTDIWKLYYAEDSLVWLGYWVKTSDHYSLVINDEMSKVRGFSLSRKRKSYRTDAQKNRLYLRADYEYSKFVIN